MEKKKHLIFTVTNDLVYDQRMQRICVAMAEEGYRVTLVGRLLPNSPPLANYPFEQIRIPCRFTKGKAFYIEYNYKLHQYLIKQSADAFCAIDLDTIIPVLLVSKKLGIPRMYDAHEYFTEMIEVKRRPLIHFLWSKVEQWAVPQFTHGYTVGGFIALELEKKYKVHYKVVRNMASRIIIDAGYKMPDALNAILLMANTKSNPGLPVILYQGALNEGRALIPLLQAMCEVEGRLFIAGSGNMETKVKESIKILHLENKVILLGNIAPAHLKYLTHLCYCGITIFDDASLNQYYSLGNKFFDYIMAHKPQVCVNYPEYQAILKQYPVALPLSDVKPASISAALNKMIKNPVLYSNLVSNTKKAAAILNWDNEKQILFDAWKELLTLSQKK